MNSQILGLRVAGTLFGLMALGQLVRLLIRPEVLVAGHQMPLWPSALAVIILGGLAFWMWTLSRRPPE
jgi:hypothetical protein